jgi:hypothetical protein
VAGHHQCSLSESQVLKLSCPAWSELHQEIKEAVIKMLQKRQKLDVLILDIRGCPDSLLRCCPPPVKHLSYVNCAESAEELNTYTLAR